MITVQDSKEIWEEIKKEHPFITRVVFAWHPVMRGHSFFFDITPSRFDISTGRRTRRREHGVDTPLSTTFSAKGDPCYTLRLPENKNWYWNFLHRLVTDFQMNEWSGFLIHKVEKEQEDMDEDEFMEFLENADNSPIDWSLSIDSPTCKHNILLGDFTATTFPPGFDELIIFLNRWLRSIGLPEIPIWQYIE